MATRKFTCVLRDGETILDSQATCWIRIVAYDQVRPDYSDGWTIGSERSLYPTRGWHGRLKPYLDIIIWAGEYTIELADGKRRRIIIPVGGGPLSTPSQEVEFNGSGNPDLENVEAQDESDRAGAVIGELRSSLSALVRLSLEWLEDRECTGTEWMGLEELRARGGVPDVIAHAERLLAEEDQQQPTGHGSTRKGGR